MQIKHMGQQQVPASPSLTLKQDRVNAKAANNQTVVLNQQALHPDRNLSARIDLLDQSSYKKLIEQSKSDKGCSSSTLVGIFGAGNKLIHQSKETAEEAAKEAMKRIRKAAAGEVLSPARELPS